MFPHTHSTANGTSTCFKLLNAHQFCVCMYVCVFAMNNDGKQDDLKDGRFESIFAKTAIGNKNEAHQMARKTIGWQSQ